MAIKGILFNTDMVHAILDERKTVTRRVIKPQPPPYAIVYRTTDMWHWKVDMMGGDFEPLYQPGDILYVRETVWQKVGYYLDVDGETKPSWCKEFKYVATDDKPEVGWNYNWAKRPSIHMPKEAARIWLRVTDVSVERLQDIDGKGIFAEGIDNGKSNPAMGKRWENMQKMAFESVWDSTIKKSDLDDYGWYANPWVWVIEFERCEKPEATK